MSALPAPGAYAATRGPRNTWSTPSTPHQRLYIRTLMQQLELDTLRVTPLHRRFFDAAKLTQPAADARIDAVLCALTRMQASNLIDALKPEVPRDV